MRGKRCIFHHSVCFRAPMWLYFVSLQRADRFIGCVGFFSPICFFFWTFCLINKDFFYVFTLCLWFQVNLWRRDVLTVRSDELSVFLRSSPRAVFGPPPAGGAALPATHTHRHRGRETRRYFKANASFFYYTWHFCNRSQVQIWRQCKSLCTRRTR